MRAEEREGLGGAEERRKGEGRAAGPGEDDSISFSLAPLDAKPFWKEEPRGEERREKGEGKRGVSRMSHAGSLLLGPLSSFGIDPLPFPLRLRRRISVIIITVFNNLFRIYGINIPLQWEYTSVISRRNTESNSKEKEK